MSFPQDLIFSRLVESNNYQLAVEEKKQEGFQYYQFSFKKPVAISYFKLKRLNKEERWN